MDIYQYIGPEALGPRPGADPRGPRPGPGAVETVGGLQGLGPCAPSGPSGDDDNNNNKIKIMDVYMNIYARGRGPRPGAEARGPRPGPGAVKAMAGLRGLGPCASSGPSGDDNNNNKMTIILMI